MAVVFTVVLRILVAARSTLTGQHLADHISQVATAGTT
jgi:hypothetical protein